MRTKYIGGNPLLLLDSRTREFCCNDQTVFLSWFITGCSLSSPASYARRPARRRGESSVRGVLIGPHALHSRCRRRHRYRHRHRLPASPPNNSFFDSATTTIATRRNPGRCQPAGMSTLIATSWLERPSAWSCLEPPGWRRTQPLLPGLATNLERPMRNMSVS